MSAADLVVRTARADERQALEALQMRASTAWPDYREQLAAHPDAVSIPAEQMALAFVAEAGGQVLGFGLVLPPQDGVAELDAMFVEPDAWRGGIGWALVRESARRAAAAGAGALHVVANPRAVAFYEACGFVLEGESETQFGPAPTMRLALGPQA